MDYYYYGKDQTSIGRRLRPIKEAPQRQGPVTAFASGLLGMLLLGQKSKAILRSGLGTVGVRDGADESTDQVNLTSSGLSSSSLLAGALRSDLSQYTGLTP